MIVFLLNGIIFILIGLQLSELMDTTEGYSTSSLIQYGLIISLVTIVARFLFVIPAMWFPSLLETKLDKEQRKNFDWKNILVISWSGMRGVLSLATAMALPLTLDDGTPMHQRKVILFITFVVIVVTLVGQGLTLPLLIRVLKILPETDNVEEEKKLRLLINSSALDFINDTFKNGKEDWDSINEVRKLYELRIAWLTGRDFHEERHKSQNGIENRSFLEQVINVQLMVTAFKRKILLKLYREGSYASENIRKLEKEMDLDESRLRSQLKSMVND